jgi:hypothetical protein
MVVVENKNVGKFLESLEKDLKINSNYKLTYLCKEDGSIKEIDAKLLQIIGIIFLIKIEFNNSGRIVEHILTLDTNNKHKVDLLLKYEK